MTSPNSLLKTLCSNMVAGELGLPHVTGGWKTTIQSSTHTTSTPSAGYTPQRTENEVLVHRCSNTTVLSGSE
jgi:hypothetical protein